jgi:hypothetical protein
LFAQSALSLTKFDATLDTELRDILHHHQDDLKQKIQEVTVEKKEVRPSWLARLSDLTNFFISARFFAFFQLFVWRV